MALAAGLERGQVVRAEGCTCAAQAALRNPNGAVRAVCHRSLAKWAAYFKRML